MTPVDRTLYCSAHAELMCAMVAVLKHPPHPLSPFSPLRLPDMTPVDRTLYCSPLAFDKQAELMAAMVVVCNTPPPPSSPKPSPQHDSHGPHALLLRAGV
ncbi:unnamed protein product [Closterium sp. Yama58-4]|nr:unnamed protein product [Closterium sp. Yama58-4]